MTKKLFSLVFGMVLSAAAPANATVFTCTVNPSGFLGLSNSGLVATLVTSVGVQQICSINDASAGVSAQACSAWYASLLTWRTQGKTGTLFYDSDNVTVSGKTSCTQFAQWDYRTPYFMQLD